MGVVRVVIVLNENYPKGNYLGAIFREVTTQGD